MRFFDSHCHFDFASFADDRAQVWARCQSQGVKGLLVPGVSPAQWSEAQTISEDYPGIDWACGVHPWWVAELIQAGKKQPDWLASMENALQHPGCRAVGECGLDAGIATPLAVQQSVLEWHLALACERRMPLILHGYKAHAPLLALLKHYRPPMGGVIHAFSGSLELAREYWQLGFYLGIGGTISYDRARKTRDTVRQMPMESLLLETDAPDMPLAGRQGARNSPEYLPEVARALAELKGISVDVVADMTWNNTQGLFGH